jgi:class 3 adenylate cyclase
MEPHIQYAKTSDGVSIAYWTLGQGKPLVHMPWAGVSHLQLDWQYPEYRRWYERLAGSRMLVRYDSRGTGLSDRNVAGFSLDSAVRDLETVVSRLGLEKFALMGLLHTGPVAIAYATRHPDKVSRLILWCSYANSSDYVASSPQLQALRAVIDRDWDTYLELVAHLVLGWSEGEQARKFASYLRDCVTLEWMQKMYESLRDLDVTQMLTEVTAPTLVLHRRQAAFPVDVARSLASRIPDARLTLLEGTSVVPFLGDAESAAAAIDEFLTEGEEAVAEAATLPSGTAVILFADIADSTALTERLGDAAFREKARELDEALRRAITSNGGTPIDGKLLGDGVLATFGAAREAIACAAAIHTAGSHAGLLLHVGVHAGDVIRESNNVYGGAVNIAARISNEAAAGETLVSGTVRDLARTSAGVSFEDRGERELKGVGEPVRVWAVREN